MPRGGARPGAGRKRAPNKATATRTAIAEASGIMPAAVMLHAMRFHFDRHLKEQRKPSKRRDESIVASELRTAHSFATDAAPYYHPKLATLQSNVNLTGRLTLEALVEASLPLPANSNAALQAPIEDKDEAANNSL